MVSLVDDDDYEELSKYKWTMGTNYGYRKEIFNGKTKNMFIQHKIMGKAQPGYVLDHINRNKLDNRKENLRFITIQQNKINSTVRRDCKSGYKGVTFCKNRTSYKN